MSIRRIVVASKDFERYDLRSPPKILNNDFWMQAGNIFVKSGSFATHGGVGLGVGAQYTVAKLLFHIARLRCLPGIVWPLGICAGLQFGRLKGLLPCAGNCASTGLELRLSNVATHVAAAIMNIIGQQLSPG